MERRCFQVQQAFFSKTKLPKNLSVPRFRHNLQYTCPHRAILLSPRMFTHFPIKGFFSRCQHPRLERSRREGEDYWRECVGTIWLIEYSQCLLSSGDNSAGESSLFMLVLDPQWVAGPTGQTPISRCI